MKRLVFRLLRPFWRLSGSIRRPLVARFDDRLTRLMAGTVNARMLPELIGPLAATLHRLERIEESLHRADGSSRAVAEEVDLVLSGLSREVFRLQVQVEQLQRTIERDRSAHAGLMGAGGPASFAIVDGADDEELAPRSGPTERAKVG